MSVTAAAAWCAVALVGCTAADEAPDGTTAPAVVGEDTGGAAGDSTGSGTGSAPSATAAAGTATGPGSAQRRAAAEAEAAYRAARVERRRFNALAIRQAVARGGVYVLTPDLDAIIQAVLVGRMYQGIAQEPQITLDTWPGVVDEIGSPVVGEVVVDDVEVYDTPRTVEGRDGVTGLVRLRGCVDVTSVRPVDADGRPLTPDPTGPRIQVDTVTVSRQPSPFTGQVGWYVADSSNTEESTCPL
jgi:hypothetical protein